MDEQTALPAWIIFILIAIGVALAVGVALLFTQLDTLQQRSLLPQATLPVVDLEATVAAGDLTVVVIVPDEFVTSTPTPIPDSPSPTPVEGSVDKTATPIFVPTCAAAPEGWVPYTVEEEDTLASLSSELIVSESMLAFANCIVGEELVAGQVILVPSLTPTPTATAPDSCVPPGDWIVYTAEEGDTLVGLANQRYTSVEELIEANCLDNIELAAGQELFVPVLIMHKPVAPQSLPGSPERPKPPMIKTPGWPSRVTPVYPQWPTTTSWPTPKIPIVTVTVPASATATPTLIPTATNTVPSTATATFTPLPTATATFTPLPTATATFTQVPSATPTPLSLNDTPTATPTNTLEPSPTSTIEIVDPTAESSPTIEATVASLPTLTPTPFPYPYP